MRLNPKVGGAAAAAAAFVIAMPAAAHPGNSGHHGRSDHSNKSAQYGHGKNSKGADNSAKSQKCKPHNVAYVESGTVNAATALAANQDGTWSGALVIDVLHANHRAKADKGTTVTYSFASQTVRFDGGATGFTASERVKLIGKEATVGKGCAALSPAATPMFRKVVVHAATSDTSSQSGSESQSGSDSQPGGTS